MERRVPPSRRSIAGAELIISTTGGYSVLDADDEYIGYLHASVGDRFRAYQRKRNELDVHLGTFTIEDGVRRILRACRRPTEDSCCDE